MSSKYGYDDVKMSLELIEILKEYNSQEDFDKWLEASLVVQTNKGELKWGTSYFIRENDKHGKVELVLSIQEDYQDCGDFDLDYLIVILVHTVILVGNVLDFSRLERQRPRLEKTTVKVAELIAQVEANWAEKVLEYIKKHPGATKKQIAEGIGFKVNVHNILADICYRRELVEEVSGKEIGYRITTIGKRNDISTIFRHANNQQKVNMLRSENDIYKVKDMLKTLTGGFCSPSTNVSDNVIGLIGQTWPKAVWEAKQLLCKEYGDRWAYSGD